MPGYRELLAQTKKNIHEVTPAEAEESLSDATFLDVRELDEYEQGTVPDSVFIPRGHLESQVENKISKDKPVVVYCAAGNRSAFAAETLRKFGYTDVVSMKGGFGRWKDEGRPWITPQVLTPEQRNRYHRHVLLPEIGEAGQQKLLESKVLLLGAAASAPPPPCTSPPPVWEQSASSTWTSSTRRTCSARSCTTSTASGSARSIRPRRH